MKKFGFVLTMLAVALVLGLAFVGCATGGDDNGGTTKFEGRWVDPSSEYYEFVGNTFTVFSPTLNRGRQGTFTFTATRITFTGRPDAWTGEYTLTYNLSGNTLELSGEADLSFGKGTYTKQ
jgi:hypothetical protein